MSGWLKMGVGLRRHPKVVRVATALKADRLRVVGALHAVWSVFDEHSLDGKLPGYTLRVMDEEIGWKGFSAGMAEIGWLLVTEDGLLVPDYEEHNGPTAKRRATESNRKAESRAEAGDVRNKDERVADWKQTKSGQMSASDADKFRAREEKRREEDKRPIPLPPIGGCPPVAVNGSAAHANGSAANPYKPPECPVAEIVALYHAKCPTLNRVEVMNRTRSGYVRQRWREVCAEDHLDRLHALSFFGDYFALAAASEFLTGRAKPKPNERPFQADFEWLVRPNNFAKVVEGKYS